MDLLDSIPVENIEILEISEEVIQLAERYIIQGALTKKSLNDALHIAVASIYNVDVLVSWNFHHIVNLKKIHEFNSINLFMGYKLIEIRSPKELINYE
ncbi:MAG: hypothetical protein NT007_06450 [Candidatus Kapabacteria bacterium]|nr:hypothetical protein [Candidatus Kapabacteria bacterium]